jgi:hypothetical protein
LARKLSMKYFAYRIEKIKFNTIDLRDQALLNVLNEFGKSGWHLRSLALSPRFIIGEGEIRILLERVQDAPANHDLFLVDDDDDDDDLDDFDEINIRK